MKVPTVLVRAKERAEPIVKNFEWTWTTAVLFTLGFAFFSVITMAVIPSANLSVGPFVTVVVIGAIMQNWRRKLRGGTSDRPTGGYR